MILTAIGAVDIASLKEGDSILTFDIRRAALNPERILKVSEHRDCRIWEITFTDGHQVQTTAVHSFRLAQGWKMARDISGGDTVRCMTKGETLLRKVSESRQTMKVGNVFNLIVEGQFSFVADDAVVHSFSYFRIPRMLAWAFYAKLRRHLLGRITKPRSRSCKAHRVFT